MPDRNRSRRCKCGKPKPPLWTRCQECRDALSEKRREKCANHEPTADEVDDLVRQQSKTLPRWWDLKEPSQGDDDEDDI